MSSRTGVINGTNAGGPVTIWYLEDGFETVVPAAKRGAYTGHETNRQLVQPVPSTKKSLFVAPSQAGQLRDALELAYCQPAVGAWFNFELQDEQNLAGWQSGLLYADGTEKPSYAVFKAEVAAVAAGQVDCSRFAPSVSGQAVAATTGRGHLGGLAVGASILGGCFERSSSTWISPWRGPVPTSGRRAIASSGFATGSISTRRGTTRRGRRRSPRSSGIPSSTTTRRSGSCSPSGSSSGWAGTATRTGAAVEMERRWSHSAHFELYDDVLPALAAVSAHGLKVGLLSNSSRNLDEFVAHHGLVCDAVLTSHAHGKTKPHESIFRAMLDRLGVAAPEAAMVGDTLADDVEGALAVGMAAVLLDREGRHPEIAGALPNLRGLTAALGLE